MAEITLEDGQRIRTFPRPPSDFDPLTASPAALAHHRLPPRLGNPKSVERYRRVWGRVKKKAKYIEPTFRVEQNRRPPPVRPTFGPTNSSWSGAVVSPPANQSFLGVSEPDPKACGGWG
jgi:hypothetical protein